MANENESDVDNFERTKQEKMTSQTPPHRDGQLNQPTAEDKERRAGTGGAVPGHDQTAADSSTPPENLHGSLHGTWEKGDQKAK